MTQDMWGTGDYKSVADKVASIGEVLVGRADIGPGMEVLDVACGAGNATIPAAKRGARVTGLDFSPGLLEIARQCGAAANVEVEWIEGDAQAMPFDDHSFDRVISAIGHMFAPDHRRTASELRRLCGPGGRIAIACWTPEGHIGEMFRRIGGISPPPPEGFESPLLWGTEDHVRELLGDDPEFERHEVEWIEPSPESYAEFMETRFPPLIAARGRTRRRAGPRDVPRLGQRRERSRRRDVALPRRVPVGVGRNLVQIRRIRWNHKGPIGSGVVSVTSSRW